MVFFQAQLTAIESSAPHTQRRGSLLNRKLWPLRFTILPFCLKKTTGTMKDIGQKSTYVKKTLVVIHSQLLLQFLRIPRKLESSWIGWLKTKRLGKLSKWSLTVAQWFFGVFFFFFLRSEVAFNCYTDNLNVVPSISLNITFVLLEKFRYHLGAENIADLVLFLLNWLYSQIIVQKYMSYDSTRKNFDLDLILRKDLPGVFTESVVLSWLPHFSIVTPIVKSAKYPLTGKVILTT